MERRRKDPRRRQLEDLLRRLDRRGEDPDDGEERDHRPQDQDGVRTDVTQTRPARGTAMECGDGRVSDHQRPSRTCWALSVPIIRMRAMLLAALMKKRT